MESDCSAKSLRGAAHISKIYPNIGFDTVGAIATVTVTLAQHMPRTLVQQRYTHDRRSPGVPDLQHEPIPTRLNRYNATIHF